MRCILTHNKSKTRAVHITSLKIRTIEKKKKLKNRDLKNLKHAKKIIIESDQNISKQRPLPYLKVAHSLSLMLVNHKSVGWIPTFVVTKTRDTFRTIREGDYKLIHYQ